MLGEADDDCFWDLLDPPKLVAVATRCVGGDLFTTGGKGRVVPSEPEDQAAVDPEIAATGYLHSPDGYISWCAAHRPLVGCACSTDNSCVRLLHSSSSNVGATTSPSSVGCIASTTLDHERRDSPPPAGIVTPGRMAGLPSRIGLIRGNVESSASPQSSTPWQAAAALPSSPEVTGCVAHPRQPSSRCGIESLLLIYVCLFFVLQYTDLFVWSKITTTTFVLVGCLSPG